MANNPYDRDWDSIGENIQKIVDQAVNSQDYQRLNQMISQVVGRAADVGSEAVRKVVTERRDRYTGYKTDGGKVFEGEVVDSSVPLHKIYPNRHNAQRQQTNPPPAQNLPVLYANPSGKKTEGILKTVGGGILTGLTAPSLLVSLLVRGLILGQSILTFSTAMTVAGLGAGVWLLSGGIRTLGRMSRFSTYVKTLGDKTYCELRKLASSVGKSQKFVKKELQRMIDDGLFLEGHMDAGKTSLITSDETYKHYQTSCRQQEERARIEAQEAQARAASGISPQVQEVLDKGNAFVQQIRACNDAIPGKEISGKIFRMEMLVGKIFQRAQEHPEVVPDLKKLMDYYLPMTVKLLNAYADMDAQPVQGETIRASKLEIENTLDTLNSAFEKLLDDLFRETAMDVSSDISVLQTLLAQEGLAEDELSRLRSRNKSENQSMF